jgi:hypothetical protein
VAEAAIENAEKPSMSTTRTLPGSGTAGAEASGRGSRPAPRALFAVAKRENQKGRFDMAAAQHDKRLNRLEYFIERAQSGKKVGVEVTLRREQVEQRVHPDETDDKTGILHMYLLFGDYLCECEGEVSTVSKIYVYGLGDESGKNGQVNKNLANARLKMDYRRLKDAQIDFEEKYF